MEKVMEISGIGDRTYFHDGEPHALQASTSAPVVLQARHYWKKHC